MAGVLDGVGESVGVGAEDDVGGGGVGGGVGAGADVGAGAWVWQVVRAGLGAAAAAAAGLAWPVSGAHVVGSCAGWMGLGGALAEEGRGDGDGDWRGIAALGPGVPGTRVIA